jgi:hypothetical protein
MSDTFLKKINSCVRTGAGGRSGVPASLLQHVLRLSVFAAYCLVLVFGVASANKPAYNDGDEMPGRDMKLSRTRLLRAGTAGMHNFHGYEDGDRPQPQQQHHNMNHRYLNEISDPKTVDLKPVEGPAQGPAPLSILSLGGSVTWGATLEDRMKAYPWMVGNAFGGAHVDNLAFRATGADFPSLCIESLIEEAGSAERSYDLVSVHRYGALSYCL